MEDLKFPDYGLLTLCFVYDYKTWRNILPLITRGLHSCISWRCFHGPAKHILESL